MSSPLMRGPGVVPPLRLLAAGLLLATALAPSVDAADTCLSPSFDPPTLVAAQVQPNGIVLGDWDRDGDLDFATTNAGSNTVSIRLGSGLGTFPTGSNPNSGGSVPRGIAAGDFDDDGLLDLVIANRNSGTVTFLRGNGAGGFAAVPLATLSGLVGATAVAVGDFDGDGQDDVAVAAFDFDRVAVYLRRGAFSFNQSSLIVTGKQPTALVLGDFDRDGDLDIVSASFPDGNLSFLRNNGAGTFAEILPRTAVGFNPTGIAAGDLNKDGILDLAVSVNGGSGTYIDVLKGNGNGTFSSVGTFPAPGGPVSVAVGDVNNDGNLDLISNSTRLLVHLGDGTGGFAAARNFPPTAGLAELAVGDLNGDGRLDVASVAQSNNEVDIFLNNSGFPCDNVSFGPAARAFPANASALGAARGDFNQDGRLDVAVTNIGAPGSVSVLLANGPGLFNPPVSYPVGNDPVRLAAGDVSGDGILDLVVTDFNSNNIAILKGTGGGAFLPASFIPVGSNPAGVALADLNRDGRLDIVVSNNGADTLSVLLNTGGGFSGPVSFTVGTNPASVQAGDVNGDGKADIVVVVNSSSSLKVLLGNGLGGFGAPLTFPLPAGANALGLVLADFDGDGDLDAATTNQALNTVSILLNNGTGAFSLLTSLAVGSNPYEIAVGDFNGDGDPDLAASNNGSGEVSVLLGGAGASFGVATYLVNPGPAVPVTGDFTGDGQPDILTAAAGPGVVTLLVGRGNGSFDVAAEYGTAGFVRDIATADFDRDGILDVVMPHPNKNNFSVHLGDGTGRFGAAITYPGTELTSPLHLVAGDFNKDGFVDLAVVQSGKVFILRGAGTAFTVINNYDATGTPVGIETADFDHDGNLDLAIALDRGAGSDQVWVYPGTGTGAFLGPIVLDFGAAMNPAGITLADFNHDGSVDLAVVHNGADRVSILFNTSISGTISFGGLVVRPAPGRPTAIAAGDFKSDGRPDLVITSDAGGSVLYLDNDPATGFAAAATSWATSVRPFAIVVEDFNLDGDLDVATASFGSDQASVLLGKGGTFQEAVNYGIAGAPAQRLVTGDFNRDGRPDLASSNGTRSSFSVLLNTNCQSRRLEVGVEPPACNIVNVPFSPQPRLLSLDDGGNLLKCDGSSLTAALLGGPGLLSGTPVQTFTVPSGVASYTNLAVTLNGIDYRLRFTPSLPEVIPARSQRFTVGLTVDILAPAPICPAVPHTFSATPKIFDRYDWLLDGTPILGSDQVVVPGQAPGSYVLAVNATFGSCAVTQTFPYIINADLSQVTMSVLTGSTLVPTGGSGATVQSNEVGGGVITSRQWSFSATTGGPYTDIPGANGATYVIRAADFPGPGVYYLVVTAVSECGTRITSAEQQVIIFTTVAGPGFPFFTATSKTNENTLEWLNPGGPFADTLLKYTVSTAGTSNCTPPATLVDGAALPLIAGLAGGKGSFVHAPLANDTAVCYTAFVHQGGGVFSNTAKAVSGRPFDVTAGRVKWAYNVGMAAIVPPGNGVGVIHAVAQDQTLHSVRKDAAGGTWPAPWIPQPLNGPSQGRPSTVVPPGPILGASRLIFLGSQGGSVYAINADTGNAIWNAILPLPGPPAPVQAAPSGYFTFFGGTRDYILVGTRGAGALNRFYALKLADGTVGWSYDGSADGLKIGVINGQATADYASRRVYFASAAFGVGVGEDQTVWCLDLETGARIWSAAAGNIMGSPIVRNGRLYVASFDGGGGKIHALDAATGLSVWGGATTFNTPPADGPVKLFVSADRFSPTGRLLFSTTNKVWALDDPAGLVPPAAPVWVQLAVPNPSAPAFPSQGPLVWVGGSDGKVYSLDYATGGIVSGIPLGDPAPPQAAVGGVTLDLAAGFLYVGTEAGIVYCVQY